MNNNAGRFMHSTMPPLPATNKRFLFSLTCAVLVLTSGAMARHNNNAKRVPISPLPSRESAQARALRILRDWVQNGHYQPGQTLPSEDAMSRQAKVSRGTLRLAIQRLKNEGLLQTQQGRRHVVPAPLSGKSLMSSTIILLCGSHETKPGLRGATFEAVDSGCFDTARELRWNLLTLHAACLEGSTRKLLADPPFGLMFSEFAAECGLGPAECDRIIDAGLPVVVQSNNARWAKYDRVVSDHADGARQLTQWLVKQGRKRILRVWVGIRDRSAYWVKARHSGHEDAMREAGLQVLPIVDVPFQQQTADLDLARYYGGFLIEWMQGANAVDAIMVNTDPAVIHAAAACQLFGKRPNEDVAIVGYDNTWGDLSEAEKNRIPGFSGPLATMDKLNYEVGQTMTRMLLDRGNNQLPAKRQLCMVAPKMVILNG